MREFYRSRGGLVTKRAARRLWLSLGSEFNLSVADFSPKLKLEL